MNNVVSFSGGKDSTAMLLMMLERGEPIHSVVFFDTGWEFPEMHDHLAQVEKYTGIEIVKLKTKKPFSYWMFEHKVTARDGDMKGKVHRIGNGWPNQRIRWCTRLKISTIEKYMNSIESPISCIGIASDEQHRVKDNSKYPKRYPLVEWDISEPEALVYCKQHGFNWGGLYDVFNRVSCFCCPLKRLGELKSLRKHYPHLWQQMLEWDNAIPEYNRKFKSFKDLHVLEARFAEDDRQLILPGIAV